MYTKLTCTGQRSVSDFKFLNALQLCLFLAFLMGGQNFLSAQDDQQVELHILADTDTLRLCDGGEELTVEVWLQNPNLLSVGGFQIYYAFPAEYLTLDRFESRGLASVNTNGPSEFGGGFPACADDVGNDLWDDGIGRDVFSLVASVTSEEDKTLLEGESVSLGAFIFKVKDDAPLGTVTLTFPLETCPPVIIDQKAVFDISGNKLDVVIGSGDLSLTLEREPVLDSLSCEHSSETGTSTLTWEVPEGTAPDAYSIYRDGELIAPFVPGFMRTYEDDLPNLCGTVQYEVALQVDGEEVECRTSCVVQAIGVENFICQVDEETSEIVLNWTLPEGEVIDSLNLYKNDELLPVDLNPLITTYREPVGDPCASVVFELAIEKDGVESPCRTRCEFGEGLVPVDFIRGDVNFSGNQDISDAILSLNFQFLGDPLITCPDAADSDDNGMLTVGDAIWILQFLFLGGELFPPPLDEAGSDPTPDDLCCY